MESKIIQLGDIEIKTPEAWEDITSEVGDGDVYTIADPEKGVGALQCSIAMYRQGKVPDFSSQQLNRLLNVFGRERGWTEGRDPLHFQDKNIVLEGITYEQGDEIHRVWYVSDGLNIALITYTCEKADRGDEFDQAEKAVKSIRFSNK